MKVEIRADQAPAILERLRGVPGLEMVEQALQTALDEQGPFTIDELTTTMVILDCWFRGTQAWLIEGPRRQDAQVAAISMLEKLSKLRDQRQNIQR